MGSRASHQMRGDQLHPVAHPGFEAVQGKIAGQLEEKGVSPASAEDRAGAILASSSRNASPAAKKANPRLKRVDIVES